MDLKPAIHKILAILFFFLALFVYTKFFGPIPFTVTNINTNKTDSFNVTGQGKVSIKPDIARLTVGVQANGKTVQQAQDQLNGAINKVSSAVKSLGVKESDIQTTNYNINPESDVRGSVSQEITGYLANTNLSIKVADIEKANAVLDAATKAGANQVGGISFDVADRSKAENEAREKAVSDAKSKASAAAKIAGFKLGKIINYSENFGGVYPLAYGAVTKNAAEDTRTNVEPGSTDVEVMVTLSYEVR
jgi:uncharacterized protein